MMDEQPQQTHELDLQMAQARDAAFEGWERGEPMIDALADTDPKHESVWAAVLAAAPQQGDTP